MSTDVEDVPWWEAGWGEQDRALRAAVADLERRVLADQRTILAQAATVRSQTAVLDRLRVLVGAADGEATEEAVERKFVALAAEIIRLRGGKP